MSNGPQHTVFIYALIDPRSGKIRYVGKAKEPVKRLQYHLSDANKAVCNGHTAHRLTWMKGLLQAGLQPVLLILEEVVEVEWEDAEKWWIAYFRDFTDELTNVANGGVGTYKAIGVGRIISEKLKGRPAWNKGLRYKGKPCSEETKRKLSEKAKAVGRKPSREALRRSAEVRKDRPGAMRGKHHTTETRERLSKQWVLTSPDGREYRIANLKEFCREQGLADSLLHHVATGKRKHHKGWLCRREE